RINRTTGRTAGFVTRASAAAAGGGGASGSIRTGGARPRRRGPAIGYHFKLCRKFASDAPVVSREELAARAGVRAVRRDAAVAAAAAATVPGAGDTHRPPPA